MANLWQNITGTVKTAFKIGRTNTATLDASGLTASRAQALPDKAGTLVVQLASGKVDGITNGTATGEALTFDAIGVSVQAYDADLAAIVGLSNGLVAITGAGTAAARTITGTTNQVTVSNGDGVSGNPTLSLPQSIDTAATFRVGSLGVGMAPTYLVDILSPTLTDFGTKWFMRARGPTSITTSATNYILAFDMDVSNMSVSAGVTDSGYRLGVRGDAYAGAAGFAGTLATQYGVLGRAGISTATAGAVVTNAEGLHGEVLNSVAGTTITNGYGLRVVNTGTTGTMTNRWGVYVDTATGGKNYFSHALGIGSTTISAQIHATSTTEQLRLGYDASNYLSTTVSSSGAVTFDSVGASAGFTFSDAVTVAGNLFLTGTTPCVDVKPSGWASSGYIQFGVSPSFAASGNYGGLYVPAGKGIAFTQAGTTLFLMDVGGNVGLGVGSTVPLAKFESRTTSGAQTVASYDASNYYSTTVSSAGAVTFDAVGASAGFTFSDAVTARSSLTLGVSSTTTGSLVLCGSGGANTHTIKAAAIPEATNSYVWPSASPTASQVLTASAPATGVVTLSWATNGVGDVVGPASSVTGAAGVFSGTTGKLLRASPTVTYYSVSAGAEDKIEFGATFKDFRTATDGATVTFDLDLSDQWQVTFAGNRTLAVSNASIGQVITILRYQDATGSRTPTWWANIAWDNGLAPVDDPTASGWSMTVLACVGLDAYSVPNWKEVCRSTSAPLTGITTATDGATVTFDLRVSPRQKVTLAGNRTLALTSGSYYVGQTFDIKLTQDATGSRTVTWWSAIKWTGGTIPTLTTTAGKSDWFRFICTDASGSPKFDILGTSMNLGA